MIQDDVTQYNTERCVHDRILKIEIRSHLPSFHSFIASAKMVFVSKCSESKRVHFDINRKPKKKLLIDRLALNFLALKRTREARN